MTTRVRLQIAAVLLIVPLALAGLTISGCAKRSKGQTITLAAGQQVANIWPLGSALLYKSEQAAADAQFDQLLLSSGKSVSVAGLQASPVWPAISADGKLVAYSTGTSIVLQPLPSGKNSTVAMPSAEDTSDTINWSPDGKFVLVHWTTREADGTLCSRIFRIDAGTAKLTEIHKSGRSDAMSVTWSPDGQTAGIVLMSGFDSRQLASSVLTYSVTAGEVKTELTDQAGPYEFDWSSTPAWHVVPAQAADAKGYTLTPCEAKAPTPGAAGGRFTLIRVKTADGKLVREFDITPLLRTLDCDLGKYNSIRVLTGVPIPGTSRWVLTVDCYAREGKGYSARWLAFLAYDSERDVLSTFSGDQPLVVTGLQDSLVTLRGPEGTRYVNERVYVVRSTTEGTALLVLDPVAGTVAPLAALSTERAGTLLWGKSIYCSDSKAVWAIDALTGERRSIATAPDGWRIVPESIWALNNMNIDTLRWARVKADAPSDKPLAVTIESAAVTGTK